MKDKFKVGDKVMWCGESPVGRPSLKKGVVVAVVHDQSTPLYVVEFEDFHGGHTCGGAARNDSGWWCRENEIEPVSRFTMGKYPIDKIPTLCESAKKIVATGSCKGINCVDCPSSQRYYHHVEEGCDVRTGDGDVEHIETAFFKEFLSQYDKADVSKDTSDILARISALEGKVSELELGNKTVEAVKKPIVFNHLCMYIAEDYKGTPRILIRMSVGNSCKYAFYALCSFAKYVYYNGPFESGQEAIDSIIAEGCTVHEFENWAIGMGYFMSQYRDVHGEG